jgi:hypothetical protein
MTHWRTKAKELCSVGVRDCTYQEISYRDLVVDITGAKRHPQSRQAVGAFLCQNVMHARCPVCPDDMAINGRKDQSLAAANPTRTTRSRLIHGRHPGPMQAGSCEHENCDELA